MALSKIFTTRYYTQNAGFFFLIFYFCFGMVPGEQMLAYHYTLLKGITGNPAFLLITLGIWLLYNGKCIGYVQKTLFAKENSFLFGTLGILEGARKWRTLFWLHFTLYAPALIYSLIAVFIAGKQEFFLTAALILFFNIAMLVFPLFIYNRHLQHPGQTPFFVSWQEWMNRRFRKPLWLIYPYELLNGNVRSLIITKLIGMVVFLSTFRLMEQAYDIRFVMVGFLITLLAHSLLIFNHRHFDDLYLPMLPQLPVPLWKRYLLTCFTYLLLLLPEYGLMCFKGNIADFPLVFITGISVLMLMRSILYFPRLNQDKYYRWVFVIIVAILFLTLAHLYWYAVILLQIIAFIIFCYRYYRYEAPLQEIQ